MVKSYIKRNDRIIYRVRYRKNDMELSKVIERMTERTIKRISINNGGYLCME